jgi:PAS domain S-box-containing protein
MSTAKKRFRIAAQVCAGGSAAGACLVLLGWLLDNAVLKSGIPGLVAMNPATAVLFLVAAAGVACHTLDLRLWRSTCFRRLAGGALLCGGVIVLTSTYVGWETGPDRILFAGSLGENRMAPNTAVYFALLGLALAIRDVGTITKWLPESLALLVLAGALVSLLGYGYNAKHFYGVGNYIPMALNTAVLFGTTALGLLCARGDVRLLNIMGGPGLGSAMARRLLPTAIVVPCVLGFLRVLGQRAGWYDTEFGAALMVAVTVTLLVTAISFTAGALNQSDRDRQQAMEALRRSANDIRDLYDNAPCGYHSLDEEGLIVSINRTELSWLGYERHEVEGRLKFTDLLTSDSRALFPSSHLAIKRDGHAADLEFELLRKDGTVLPIRLTATAIRDDSGKYLSSRSSVLDATERRQSEKAIRQLNESLEVRVQERTAELGAANHDLAQKNQENEMFVYSVSHDLRSPLVNLQGFGKELGMITEDLKSLLLAESVPEAVRKQAMALLEGDVQQSLHFIHTATTRLSNIIDALLRLSRVGRVEYQFRDVDLQCLVSQVAESLSAGLFDAGITIKASPLMTCVGDATALEQLFANLIGNAIKYRDPCRAGVIEIGRMPAVTNGAHATVGTFYVRDNGLGIPEAHQEKIFQAFKRAHPTVAPGDGMGLAIVRRIVDRHGGSVWVESREGQGSTFFFTLPVSGSCSSASSLPSSLAQGGYQHGGGIHGDLIGGRR